MRIDITISVSEIKVSKEGWYSFHYYMKIGDRKPKIGVLDGSYSSQTANAFRKVLQRGYAFQLVLQHYF